MTLLALESSSQYLSVALFQGERLIDESIKAPDGRGHSECLLPLLHELLNKHQMTLEDVSALALTSGPGSFTSLRVGMASVMGLAIQHELPVYLLSSLKVLARELVDKTTNMIVPVMKAGRGRLYAAAYHPNNGNLEGCLQEAVYQPDELAQKLQKLQVPLHILGQAVDLLPLHSGWTTDSSLYPKASQVGRSVFLDRPQSVPLREIQINYLQGADIG